MRRGALAQRSRAEWGVRALLASVAAVLACTGVARTLAYTVRSGNPEQAQTLWPGDGRITALAARALAGGDATAADRVRADRLARAALRQDPTAVVAVSTLGIDAQARGDTAGARRLFAYAETLSRRDLQTQLWAIEDAVGRGDIPGVLRHYDIALRTWRDASDLLFPILGTAIADPSIRTALIRRLGDRPAWGGPFVDYVAGNGPDPHATVALFVGLRRAGIAIPEGADATIVSTLVSRNVFDTAWRYYASFRGTADRRMSRDPDFSGNVVTPTPFDWRPLNGGGISTSIQPAQEGGVFDYAAPASVDGALLQQMQLLPPGSYRLEGHGAGIDQPDNTRPYWTLTCSDGRELGRVAMPTSANGAFAGRFTVPTNCPVQTLAFVARPSDAAAGTSGQIDRIRLYPER